MEIDTLIFSGGGIKCLCLLGSLKYLIENDIIKEDLSTINTIICVSGGLIHVLPLILGYTINEVIQIFIDYDYHKYINYDQFEINGFLLNYGIFNNICNDNCEIFLKYKDLSVNITLKELYEKTKINLIVKVINLNKNEIIYINYISHPDLYLKTLVTMTTNIPIFFKPILYKDEYYIDGGVCGNFPIEANKSKKYLGFNICNNDTFTIHNITDYLSSLFSMIGKEKIITDKRIINFTIDYQATDFNLTKKEKINIIKEGYSQTEYFIKNYK